MQKAIISAQTPDVSLLGVIPTFLLFSLREFRTASGKAGAAHHGRQGGSPVHMGLGRSSEAALPLSGGCSFCAVTPVAAHPLGEVAVVVLVVVHHERGQEPEGHDAPAAVFCSGARTVLLHVPPPGAAAAGLRVRAAPADLLVLWLCVCVCVFLDGPNIECRAFAVTFK